MGAHNFLVVSERDEDEAYETFRARNEELFDGMRAGRNGLPSSLNPFEAGTLEHDLWAEGWRRGAAGRAAGQIREHLKARAA